ncbi:DNA gyrase inhibitor YacG [Pacificibacter marinus]|uniref:DNA gyrase inhibitor YacG n=1 Tax=Pacificibacter marinus TaxID=658057 RepID=UPI001C06CE9C|nr:DNA gyrase inhibitor YacG [Pacificibacter marinus]MBU2868476.1 DNA gyrase inhibitor YacG [Pacificibacter marinus]
MSCPICQKEGDVKYRPFCSKRCADVDLSRWLSGTYAVPSMREEDPEEVMRAYEEGQRIAQNDLLDGLIKKPH